MNPPNPKIAFVHDWLVVYAGSERVLEQMIAVFPEADLFGLIDYIPKGDRGFLNNKPVSTSLLQTLPFVRSKYRAYLPVMPFAVEQFDLSGYDIVISSSHAVAKGVLTGPNQLHLCMCYSPIRYAWDMQHQYLAESGLTSGIKSLLARWLLHKIRLWDVRTSNGVDEFIAISHFVGHRIWKTYRRESTVIYPPVDIDAFTLVEEKDDFYLTASRMVPYKKIDLIVEAFRDMPDKRLVVIGDGPDFEKIRARAGTNVELLGYQQFKVLRDYMQRSKAFIFAAQEDFGIAPLEAQACGTPVIAFNQGGARETIMGLETSSPTGVFFSEQSVASITQAVSKFEAESKKILSTNCRKNAVRFAPDQFRREFSAFVSDAWGKFENKRNNYLNNE